MLHSIRRPLVVGVRNPNGKRRDGRHRAWGAVVGLALAGVAPGFAVGAQLNLGSVDLGQVNGIGGVDWNYTLGTSWDTNFSIGAIIGSANSTIIPEVDAFGRVIIPAVTADTRTGAQMTGNISGDAGLRLNLSINPSQLSTGSNFDFNPTVNAPANIQTGTFFNVQTTTGLNNDQGFSASNVSLPSFHAGMNLFLDMNLQSTVQAGLFPVIPYSSANFNKSVHVDAPLLDLTYDMKAADSSLNMFSSLPSFATQLVETAAESVHKNLQVDVNGAEPGGNVTIGSVRLYNPLDPINLTANATATATDVKYSFQTPVMSLGLDLGGAAAVLSGNPEFATNVQATIGSLATINTQLLDIQYGPELGYKESVDLKPDYDVTLHFDHTVIIKDAAGNIHLVNPGTGYDALWSSLPAISLLGSDPVNVSVDFKDLTGTQTKTESLYLTDLLDLRLLTVTDLKVLDKYDISLPALVNEHTSLIGSLLGEADINIATQTETIAPIALNVATQNFTLQTQPSLQVYLDANATSTDPTKVPGWLNVSDNTQPTALSDKTLVFGQSAVPVTYVGDLQPVVYQDAGYVKHESLTDLIVAQGIPASEINQPPKSYTDTVFYDDPGSAVTVKGIEVLANSEYHMDGGKYRQWKLDTIQNDGVIESDSGLVFTAANQLLQITGGGQMILSGESTLNADVLYQGEGHTITFASDRGVVFSTTSVPVVYEPFLGIPFFAIITAPVITLNNRPLNVTQSIENSGTIIFNNTNAAIMLASDYNNTATGQLQVNSASQVTLSAPSIVQDGLTRVDGAGSMLTIAGSPIISTTGATGTFEASNGGVIVFSGAPKIGLQTSTYQATPQFSMTFRAASGGEVQFAQPIEQRFDVQSNYVTDVGGTITLNGIVFPEQDNAIITNPGLYTTAASRFINIENHGTLVIASGNNNLFLKSPDSHSPDVPPPTPVPFIVPINLTNDGTIQISAGAEFGFQVEIKDYAPGGANLVGGTWALIGANQPWTNTTAPPGANQTLNPSLAVLNVTVVKVSNGDNILGDTFDIGNYETQLAINSANVTLSGAASFPYFNTINENRGTINLAHQQNFITAGDLTNSGNIHIDTNAILQLSSNVSGTYTNNGGNTTLTNGATLIANKLIINGGSVTADASSSLTGNLFLFGALAGPITIADQFDPSTGVTQAAVLNLAAAPAAIATTGNLTLAGAHAEFVGLGNALTTNHGTLTITNGNSLTIDNASAAFANEGALYITNGGQLTIHGSFTSKIGTFAGPNSGTLDIGENSYLRADSISLLSGTVTIDGVLSTPHLTITPGTTVNGSGRIAGNLDNSGLIDIGHSPGRMEIFGGVNQSATGAIDFQIFGQDAGDGYDQLVVHGNSSFGGTIHLLFGSGFVPLLGKQWVLVDVLNTLDTDAPSAVDWLIQNIQVTGLDPFTGNLPAGFQMINPSDQILGEYNGDVVLLSYDGGSGNSLVVYTTPEPGALLLLVGGGLLFAAGSGRRFRRAPR